MKRRLILVCLVLCALFPAVAAAANPSVFPLFTVTPSSGGAQTYSVSLQVLAVMTLLSFLPAALIMMTSFTRIIVVLAILRQGLGTAQTPSNQILIGIALFLTFFIMSPVFTQAYKDGIKPYLSGSMPAQTAIEDAAGPFKTFMLHQTRESDLALFAKIAHHGKFQNPQAVPFSLLVPAFVTSELKTAFQIGFLLLIPFLIIDLVVASVLMSMGMVMLSPMIISLPFKLMLFVLVNGWALVMGTLAASFYH
ncbi:flagellar type III secretion system pore protein FliP [Acidihalobacter ferrooxydans]|uniref:Flagellar biosynthetic protein FliP n=1 Tax=Acidihalobacter ferrooxydans TaxID=1765967 RepID=A0A1P8UGS1_9GAMM|nr:flagellar type III secretion system pore protein FliP [Acidihalobacter ferrooxydans]APZ43019.1 flagellar biosynthetic protein FliP [Acidihalobacter ferrooxydans]